MKERIADLYTRYRGKRLSKEELEEFLMLLNDSATRKEIELLADAEWSTLIEHRQANIDWEFMYTSITSSHIARRGHRMRTLITRMAVAAAVITIIVSGYFLTVPHSDKNNDKTAIITLKNIEVIQDVLPANNVVVLTLANGEKIIVDNIHNGQHIANDQALPIKEGTSLNYEMPAASATSEITWHTVATPKGKQFRLVLSDGSIVWMNAASSVRYPVAFAGPDRRIEVTGEVYLDVHKDPDHPFIASVGDVDIQVLGTSFNIKAYHDEDGVTTTLVEGKVNLRKGERSLVMSPNQQVMVPASGPFTMRNGIDTDIITAWKQGIFYFDKADINTILREISRWYDVEVNIEGSLPQKKYWVIINRSSSLSSVLTALKATDLKFKIDNKRLLVQPAKNR